MYEGWCSELAQRPLPCERRGFADELGDLAVLRGALDSREARLLAGIEGLGDNGAPASAVARSVGRCSQREADRKAQRAATLVGLPSAAEALAEGRLTVEHVDALARAVEATSAQQVEASGLVDKGSARPADLAAKDAREWTRRQQSDADLAAAQLRRHEARRLSVWENDDGMTVLHGEFDPVTGRRIKKALDAETNRLFHTDGGRDEAGEARTPEQRRADAMAAMLTGGRPTGEAAGAVPVRNQLLLMATVSGEGLVDAHFPDGSPLPMAVVERLACGSDLFALVLSAEGDPLWMGRRVRLATDGQWRALIARDGGCVICDADPSRCQAHHLVVWEPPGRGPTDIVNLVLLCSHHHHLVHDRGWQLVASPDGGWTLEPP